MATATCPHGFSPSACLICQTLGITAAPSPKPARQDQAQRHANPTVEVEVAGRRHPGQRLGIGPRLLGLAVIGVGVALAVWFVVSALWALLRVAELVGVAALSGYCAWKLGVRHGRRHPR